MARWFAIPLLLTAFPAPLAAQPSQSVRLESAVFVESVSRDLDGRQRRLLTTPGQLGQGDRLVFLLRYRNDGKAAVNGFAVTNPVPPSVRLDAHPDMLVSVDGGRNWGRLDALQVRTLLGGTRRATADDVTHVRWTVRTPVSPGAGGQIVYRGAVR